MQLRTQHVLPPSHPLYSQLLFTLACCAELMQNLVLLANEVLEKSGMTNQPKGNQDTNICLMIAEFMPSSKLIN